MNKGTKRNFKFHRRTSLGIVFLAGVGMGFVCCSDGGDGTESSDLNDAVVDGQIEDGQPEVDEGSEESDSDGADSPATCEWNLGNPNGLVATGAEEGDTIANATFVDQCNKAVDLWDFAGEYHVIFLTAAW